MFTSLCSKSFKFRKFNYVIVMKAKKRLVCDLWEVNDAACIQIPETGCDTGTLSVKENRGTDEAPITWDCFSETFLDIFFPIELRQAKAQDFMNL